jgi:hypothetical protein
MNRPGFAEALKLERNELMEPEEKRKMPVRHPPEVRDRAVRMVSEHAKDLASEWKTIGWVDWFNHRLLLEPIGNNPSAEAAERYYKQLNEPAMVA